MLINSNAYVIRLVEEERAFGFLFITLVYQEQWVVKGAGTTPMQRPLTKLIMVAME